MDPELKDLGLPGQTLGWLLDPNDPSPRYLTLTKLLGKSDDSPSARTARAAIPRAAPARDILQAQYPQGYWMHPGIGSSPRYRATLWQILILAQLGMNRCGPLDRAVQYLFEVNQREDGAFRASKEPGDVPISLNASLLWALQTLGYGEEVEVRSAWSWLVDEVERRTQAKRWRRRPASPWEVKVLWAVNARLDCQTPQPADGDPLGDTVLDDGCLIGPRLRGLRACLAGSLASRSPRPGERDPRWFRLTFPQLEGSDLLEWLTVLVDAGYGHDPRLGHAKAWLRRHVAAGAYPGQALGRCGRPR